MRAWSLAATSISWQGCDSIVVPALHVLNSLLAIRRWAAVRLRWHVTRRRCWLIGDTVLLLWFATACSARATRRMLLLLSLQLPGQLLCLVCLLLSLSASLPSRYLLIVSV